MLPTAVSGPVSRASSVHTVMRNYTGDEGRSFEFDNQVLISSHRKLLWSKAMVVNVAEKSGLDPVRHGRERRAYRRLPHPAWAPSAVAQAQAATPLVLAP